MIIGLVNIGEYADKNPLANDTGSEGQEIDQGSVFEVENPANETFGGFVTEAGKCYFGGVLFGLDGCKNVIEASIGSTDIGRQAITIVNGIGIFTDSIKAFFTFDVPGAPGWVRGLFAIPMNITLMYLLIQLFPTT